MSKRNDIQEILREFAGRAHPPLGRRNHGAGADHDPEFGGWSEHANHALYMPPWRDRLSTGELVDLLEGRNYQSESAFSDAQQTWLQSRAGGGLWDEEQAPKGRAHAQRLLAVAARYDGVAVSAFVLRHGHQLPVRELEVYALWWVQLLSYGQTARRLFIGVATVRDLVRRLRARVQTRAQIVIQWRTGAPTDPHPRPAKDE